MCGEELATLQLEYIPASGLDAKTIVKTRGQPRTGVSGDRAYPPCVPVTFQLQRYEFLTINSTILMTPPVVASFHEAFYIKTLAQ